MLKSKDSVLRYFPKHWRWLTRFLEVLFGIDDNGNIKGLSDVKQACLDIENKINDSITPQPDYTLELQNNDRTIKLTVKSGLQKPYLYKSKAYKRNDTAPSGRSA